MSDDDAPEERRTEGVRIIGAQEAAEAAERPDVVRRRRGSEKRYGDRPDAPAGVSDLPKITISTTESERGRSTGGPAWHDPSTTPQRRTRSGLTAGPAPMTTRSVPASATPASSRQQVPKRPRSLPRARSRRSSSSPSQVIMTRARHPSGTALRRADVGPRRRSVRGALIVGVAGAVPGTDEQATRLPDDPVPAVDEPAADPDVSFDDPPTQWDQPSPATTSADDPWESEWAAAGEHRAVTGGQGPVDPGHGESGSGGDVSEAGTAEPGAGRRSRTTRSSFPTGPSRRRVRSRRSWSAKEPPSPSRSPPTAASLDGVTRASAPRSRRSTTWSMTVRRSARWGTPRPRTTSSTPIRSAWTASPTNQPTTIATTTAQDLDDLDDLDGDRLDEIARRQPSTPAASSTR